MHVANRRCEPCSRKSYANVALARAFSPFRNLRVRIRSIISGNVSQVAAERKYIRNTCSRERRRRRRCRQRHAFSLRPRDNRSSATTARCSAAVITTVVAIYQNPLTSSSLHAWAWAACARTSVCRDSRRVIPPYPVEILSRLIRRYAGTIAPLIKRVSFRARTAIVSWCRLLNRERTWIALLKPGFTGITI